MQFYSLTWPSEAMIQGTRARKTSLALALALILLLLQIRCLQAEDQLDYRYEYYQEDDDRIQVQTHSVLFDVTLKEGLVAVAGELVHDAVSGATPSGAAPPNQYTYVDIPGVPILGNTNSTSVPLQHMQDTRNSISLQVPVTLGIHLLTPQFAYSEESDYKSTGAALNYSLALFEKNTTLNFGWAHTWDLVRDDTGVWQDKSGDDFLVGCNQLLGPKTVLGVNLTYGMASGYLNDPYRFIVGATDPQLDANNPAGHVEERPNERDKFVARFSLTQFITPVDASVEGAYRFYHDTYGIDAHTFELAWYQNVGKHIVISPMCRYYYQSAADFYYEILPGSAFTLPPSNPGSINNPPQYYSPDYRLSNMQTFTAGINVMVKATKWLIFDASYKRYVMQGLDGVTSQTAYPSANVFTIGARILF
jgi:hypothetical protein